MITTQSVQSKDTLAHSLRTEGHRHISGSFSDARANRRSTPGPWHEDCRADGELLMYTAVAGLATAGLLGEKWRVRRVGGTGSLRAHGT